MIMVSNAHPLVCIFISTLTVCVISCPYLDRPVYCTHRTHSTPWVEAYLFLSLAFDIVIFLTIIYTTLRATRYFTLTRIMHVIQRDGIIYFFTLFSSNLVWVLLLLHARVGSSPVFAMSFLTSIIQNGLKFMHNQYVLYFPSSQHY